VLYSFQMKDEGLSNANNIDSKDATQLLYSHQATSFESEGIKSLAQGDTPGSMWGSNSQPYICDTYVVRSELTLLSVLNKFVF
jgi:hypothetical protein